MKFTKGAVAGARPPGSARRREGEPEQTLGESGFGPPAAYLPHEWHRETVPLTNYRRNWQMTSLMTRLWQDDGGQDMAEYAIMLGVIAAVVLTAITLLGTNISTEITKIA